ncbi:hypothetical protein HBD59_000015 [Salmonella enterica]|nr:hypothetical protein [Salmonella enterica]EGY4577537.1 hypothetical protein [Salmonella enterica]EGY4584361.1 hypothetical protein [Salmonella enterica]EGY9841621.1 hypothetical protein [Salmonella enterica]EIG1197411.1 hypothetical protein [Salmonella enterica]
MNIILKKLVTTAAAVTLIAYHTNATATAVDPSDLSEESYMRATTTVKAAVEPPTVEWHAIEGVDTNVTDGAHIGAIRVTKIGGGRVCVRTDDAGKYGNKFVMMNGTGERATMTLDEVAVIPRVLEPTTTYATAGCTESKNTNILMALKKSGDGMHAGEYQMNLYFAIWSE